MLRIAKQALRINTLTGDGVVMKISVMNVMIDLFAMIARLCFVVTVTDAFSNSCCNYAIDLKAFVLI